MGHTLSSLHISIQNPVISSLASFTHIEMDKLASIHNSMLLASHHTVMVSSDRAGEVLQPYLKNHSPLVQAFSMSVGADREHKINIYYLSCALCIYSRGSWIGKLRCKCYIVIFNMFIKHEADSLPLEQLERLVRSSIKGVSIMTGTKFPHEKLYHFLAGQILELAARQSINRIYMEEFSKLVHSDPDIMSVLELLKPSTSPELQSPRLNQRPQTLVGSQSSQSSFRRSLNRIQTVPGAFLTHRLPSINLPSIQTPRISQTQTQNEKMIVESFNFVQKLKKQVLVRGEVYVDLVQHIKSQNIGDPKFSSMKSWADKVINLNEAVQEFTPYLDQMNKKAKENMKNTVSHQELDMYAKLYTVGDVDGLGWDKSDVYEMLGKRSAKNAYYIIHRFKVSSSNRFKFSDYLRVCLSENKEFDDSQVNEFYTSYRLHK